MNKDTSERIQLDYGKDNIERVPFEHYLAEYQKLDPKDIERRCGFRYDEEKKEFSVNFLMKPYRVTFPEYQILLYSKGDFWCQIHSVSEDLLSDRSAFRSQKG